MAENAQEIKDVEPVDPPYTASEEAPAEPKKKFSDLSKHSSLFKETGDMHKSTEEQPKEDKRLHPKKDGRGRPKGSTKKEKTQPDLIGQALNTMLLPVVAKIMGLDLKTVLFSKEEMDLMHSLQPETDFTKPSWPAYIVTTCILTGSHIAAGVIMKKMMAKTSKELEDRANAIKKPDNTDADMSREAPVQSKAPLHKLNI